MTNIVSSAAIINGTADGDIIIGVGPNQTINGGGGRDVIFGDHDELFNDTGAGNGSVATAMSIDASFRWSREDNPDVGDSAVPYTSVLSVGAGEYDYYKVLVGDGDTITVDVDYGGGQIGGPALEPIVTLRDALDAQIPGAISDNSPISSGGSGSVSTSDSYLTYTNNSGSAQFYFIRVEDSFTGVIDAGATFMLNVSVDNHSNTNSVFAGDDTISGGDGHDVLFGMGGSDTISGDAGSDTIYGGAGNDTIEGGAGSDWLYGGAGGNDVLSYAGSTGAVDIDLISGATGSNGHDFGDTISGFESLTGSAFRDTLKGDDGENTISGGDENDTITGRGGVDTLFGGAGKDKFIEFSNIIEFGEVFDGGSGNDTLQITKGGGVATTDLRVASLISIEKLALFDQHAGAPGMVSRVMLNASQFGFTSVSASAHAGQPITLSVFMDTSLTLDLSGVDFLGFSEVGDTVNITGDADDEVVTGSSIRDSISTGDGNDTLIIGSSGLDFNEFWDGGAGMDELDFSALAAAHTINLETGVFDLVAGGAASSVSRIEIVRAGSGDDFLSGGITALPYQLYGGGGNDRIAVGSGSIINGEIYDGGIGTDTLDATAPGSSFLINLLTEEFDDPAFLAQAKAFGFENVDTGSGDDTIIGDNNANVINAGGGADRLVGGGGNDMLNGGAGLDTADYSAAAGNVTVRLDMGTAVGGFTGSDTLISIENVDGSNFNDSIFGDDLANVINGNGGNDTIFALGADDIVNGGDGDDTLNGNADADTLNGDAGDDAVLGAAGDDILNGGIGNDVVSGGTGDDTISGGAGVDTLFGGAGLDSLFGNDGSDVLSSGGGDDIASGGNGNDLVLGANGDDLLFGGAGSDTVSGGAGKDTVSGGSGNDTVFGAVGNDTVSGGAGNDKVSGGAGGDLVFGNSGDDSLIGASGPDRLDGGTGNDILTGGADADTIVFALAYEFDRAQGFEDNIDTIELDSTLWGGGLTEAQVVTVYANQISAGVVEFDFGGGDILRIIQGAGIAANDLVDDITIV